MMASIEGIPAILGGAPLRPAGPPDWPGENAAVSERVGRILADGSWGKYHGPHVAELTDLLVMAHGVPHVIPCASGTAAVELAQAMGVEAAARHDPVDVTIAAEEDAALGNIEIESAALLTRLEQGAERAQGYVHRTEEKAQASTNGNHDNPEV